MYPLKGTCLRYKRAATNPVLCPCARSRRVISCARSLRLAKRQVHKGTYEHAVEDSAQEEPPAPAVSAEGEEAIHRWWLEEEWNSWRQHLHITGYITRKWCERQELREGGFAHGSMTPDKKGENVRNLLLFHDSELEFAATARGAGPQ
jgi:hypothetical protein